MRWIIGLIFLLILIIGVAYYIMTNNNTKQVLTIDVNPIEKIIETEEPEIKEIKEKVETKIEKIIEYIQPVEEVLEVEKSTEACLDTSTCK